MKIGIVTHYNVHNHGAQLQLYALCSFFRDLGHEASALTYTKNYDFLGRKLAAKYSISLQSIPIYLRYQGKGDQQDVVTSEREGY